MLWVLQEEEHWQEEALPDRRGGRWPGPNVSVPVDARQTQHGFLCGHANCVLFRERPLSFPRISSHVLVRARVFVYICPLPLALSHVHLCTPSIHVACAHADPHHTSTSMPFAIYMHHAHSVCSPAVQCVPYTAPWHGLVLLAACHGMLLYQADLIDFDAQRLALFPWLAPHV